MRSPMSFKSFNKNNFYVSSIDLKFILKNIKTLNVFCSYFDKFDLSGGSYHETLLEVKILPNMCLIIESFLLLFF